MKLATIPLLSLILSLGLSKTTIDPRVSGLSWDSCIQDEFYVNVNSHVEKVTYSYCREDGGPSDKYITENMKVISEEIINYMSSISYIDECKEVNYIEVYGVNLADLNLKLFPELVSNGHYLLGIYDPRVDSKSQASIYLTSEHDLGTKLLAHEMAHYWYDRMCFGKAVSDSEDFALAIEGIHGD